MRRRVRLAVGVSPSDRWVIREKDEEGRWTRKFEIDDRTVFSRTEVVQIRDEHAPGARIIALETFSPEAGCGFMDASPGIYGGVEDDAGAIA